MRRVNDFWFYHLGYVIHALADVKPGTLLGDISGKLLHAKGWLDTFMDGDEVFPFTVSLESAQELRDFLDTLVPTPQAGQQTDYSRAMLKRETARLAKLTKDFETVVAAEVGTFSTYSVVQKLAYSTRVLIEHGECVLPEEVRSKVPPETIKDLREATKCMAFEVNTASGFHTIRATETVIRSYYLAVVGTGPTAKDRNWGAYIRVLKAKGADPRVTGFLDHIRESYRNPVTHPEQKLDADEAQVLLGVCISAIVQMVTAIDALHALAVVQPNSTLALLGLMGDER